MPVFNRNFTLAECPDNNQMPNYNDGSCITILKTSCHFRIKTDTSCADKSCTSTKILAVPKPV
jgi:hypothetical protein